MFEQSDDDWLGHEPERDASRRDHCDAGRDRWHELHTGRTGGQFECHGWIQRRGHADGERGEEWWIDACRGDRRRGRHGFSGRQQCLGGGGWKRHRSGW